MGEIPDDESEAEGGFADLRATQRLPPNVDRDVAAGTRRFPAGAWCSLDGGRRLVAEPPALSPSL